MLVYLLSIGFLISLSISSTAAPHVVHGIRFGWHGTYARIVFDVGGEVSYQIVATEEPAKIVVAFPDVSQPPKPDVWRTSIPLIEEVRFIGAPGKVSAEIKLTRHGIIRKHYWVNTPPRIVIDIVTPPNGATDRESQASRPSDKGAERVTSALTTRQAPEAAVMSPTPQEEKGQRPPPAIKGPPLPPEGKEQRPPQEAKGPSSPQTAGQQVVPLLLPASESLTTLSEPELLSLAERHWQQGQFLAAQGAYKKFLERFPGYSHNHLIAVRLADILHNQQQYREALEAYAQVMTRYPGSEGGIISEMRMAELGLQVPHLIPQNQDTRFTAYHSPIASLRTLIQTYPQSPLADVARFKIGVIQLQRHEAQTALAAFQELLNKPLKEDLRREVQAKYREALQTVMSAWQGQGRHAEVLRTFFMHKGQLSPKEAESPDFLLPVAISYARLGLLPEAQSLFQVQMQATKTPQQRGPLALEQADVLAARGLFQEAKICLKDAEPHAEEATRRQILIALGKLTLQMGQPEEAVQYLRRGEGIIPSAAERAPLFALLGAGYVAQDRHKEGLQAFQQCVELATADAQAPLPSAETCLFRVAEILFAQRQYQPALPVYEKLLAAFPQTNYRHVALFRMAAIARALTNSEQMQYILETLRDTSTDPLWQKVATDMLEETTWQRQFHERLAEFQNHLMR